MHNDNGRMSFVSDEQLVQILDAYGSCGYGVWPLPQNEIIDLEHLVSQPNPQALEPYVPYVAMPLKPASPDRKGAVVQIGSRRIIISFFEIGEFGIKVHEVGLRGYSEVLPSDFVSSIKKLSLAAEKRPSPGLSKHPYQLNEG